MFRLPRNVRIQSRSGTLLSLAAVLLVLLFGFAAFSVDVGYIRLVRSELQNAAETAALKSVTANRDAAEVQQIAANSLRSEIQNVRRLKSPEHEVQTGLFDPLARTFTPDANHWNAVSVTAWAMNEPLFFAPSAGQRTFNLSRTSIAVWTPRDIVFVVDLCRPTEQWIETLEVERLISLRGTLTSAFEQLALINGWLPPGAVDRAALVTLIDHDGERGFVAAPLTSELPVFVRGLSDLRFRSQGKVVSTPEPAISKARKMLRTLEEGGTSRANVDRLIVQIDTGAGAHESHSARGSHVRISIPVNGTEPADLQAVRLQAFLENVIRTRSGHIVR